MPDPSARSRFEHPAASAGGVAVGRPRVFGVAARAIPLSSGGGSLLEQGIDVALLMTPRSDEPFAIRVPRGTLDSGRRFVLRCPGLERSRGALAQTTAVSELGVHFDLVTAEMVHATEPSEQDGQLRAPLVARAARPLSEPARPEVDLAPAGEHTHDRRLSQHASASAVEIGGVATIAAEVSTTLLTPLQMGQPIKLVAPRGEIEAGAYFALRYFDAAGARRALVRADTVRARPGMLDEVVATLIRVPTRAEERQSYRAAFNSTFSAETRGPNGQRTIRGQVSDLSAGGIGFRATAALAVGSQIEICDPSLDDLDGAELLVIRRDPRDPQRYGARFVEPNRGAATLARILGISQAEREHRRRLQIEEIRRRRSATATPLTDADIQNLRNRRMGTRNRGDRHDQSESSDES